MHAADERLIRQLLSYYAMPADAITIAYGAR